MAASKSLAKATPATISLRGSERRELERIARAHSSPQAIVVRAKIVLLAAQGCANYAIASELGCNVDTVRKWRGRYAELRHVGLQDAPRSGHPPTFSPEQRCSIVNLIVTKPADGLSRWTLTELRDEAVRAGIVKRISRETIGHWLRLAEIKIHRVKYWLNSKDPDFKTKMERVVGLYLRPPPGSTVLCLDEKTGIQAKERIAPEKPAKRGQIRKVEWEYKRHGTVSLMASFHVRTGEVVGRCIESNNSTTFIAFVRELMQRYPKGKLYLVMDNGSSHTSGETQRFLKKHRRLEPVYLPTHCSWLNQIEIWFSVLTRKSLHNVNFLSNESLVKQITDFITYHNRYLKHPYRWTYSGQPLAI